MLYPKTLQIFHQLQKDCEVGNPRSASVCSLPLHPKAHPMNIDKITRARTQLVIEHPFFGSLALRLKLVAKPDLPHLAAVDGRHVYYNEARVNELTLPQIQGLLAHEVGHCMFEHFTRRNSRDPFKWNVAGDYAINDILLEAGFQLPEQRLHDVKYRGMTAEQIYDRLPDLTSIQGSTLDEIMDGEGGGDSDGEGASGSKELAAEWKIATLQAASAAKAQGKLPANLERFVNELTESKTDWRAQLRRFVTERSKDDYSWSRPNRRYLSAGMYLPSMYSESMGEIVVAIDTSGSIDQATLDAFGSEIKAIRDAVRPRRTTVIYCDARVNHVDEFTPEDELAFKMYGGGGTDFRPPFAHLDQRGDNPVCFVYLTDMYGSFPDTPPPYPVIWCAISDVVAPWGETLQMEV